mmetsp:Transcript_21293/g.48040  ORF Transcript_21293/g.48040 Transcript_21293/m.48040 type:complete len:126 (+) Transcript_21293:173-550(+)
MEAASAIAHKAVEADRAGRLEEARSLYEDAAQGLIEVCKATPDERTRSGISAHVEHYLNRAQEIEGVIGRRARGAVAQSSGAQSSPANPISAAALPDGVGSVDTAALEMMAEMGISREQASDALK